MNSKLYRNLLCLFVFLFVFGIAQSVFYVNTQLTETNQPRIINSLGVKNTIGESIENNSAFVETTVLSKGLYIVVVNPPKKKNNK
jgi:hypothetical protein